MRPAGVPMRQSAWRTGASDAGRTARCRQQGGGGTGPERAGGSLPPPRFAFLPSALANLPQPSSVPKAAAKAPQPPRQRRRGRSHPTHLHPRPAWHLEAPDRTHRWRTIPCPTPASLRSNWPPQWAALT